MPDDPRLAATVLLLRDHPEHGLQVWMMERSRAVGFMPRAWVFPGGRVDPADSDVAVRVPEDPCDVPRAAWAAGARELEEEAGVRLGDPDGYDLRGAVPWARWITPEVEPRRYDTWFLAAALPSGQEPRADGVEASQGAWFAPAEAIARVEAGGLPVAPPTLRTLQELSAFATVAAALGATRRVVPICPRFHVDSAGATWVLLPGDAGHPSTDPVAPPTRFRFDAGRWWARPA
jgi:8-oxo-dGTP pyrophosphatase MutT (NUDIX family)